MLKAAFLHDTAFDFIGGAELSNKRVLDTAEECGVLTTYDNLSDFGNTKQLINESDFVIVNSIFNCPYEFLLIDYLAETKKPYVKWEHDYNFCEKRHAMCFVDINVKGCCKGQRVNAHRKLFLHAALSVFTSPKHYKLHSEMYGEAIGNHFIVPPLINPAIQPAAKETNTVCFASQLCANKGGNELIDFAIANPHMQVLVYGDDELGRQLPPNLSVKGKQPPSEVLTALSKSEYFFFNPRLPEPCGRVAAEAFLSGCKTITNDRVGFHSNPYYPAYPEVAREAIQDAPYLFWQQVKNAVTVKIERNTHWKNVLIYKSFGGLGDFIFALPAINKIIAVSDTVSLCVPPMLLGLLKKQLPGITIFTEDYIRTASLHDYDKVIDLKNYPSFKKDEGNEHQMNFPSYRRLNQHAIRHYLDAVATLHPQIDNSYTGFPYFKKSVTDNKLYFTVHAGAGFAAKHYPAKYFGRLIDLLLTEFEELECRVIAGPEDPTLGDIFEVVPERVSTPQGKLEDIADVISGALFHIGNDSGITHLADAYNIPTVAIHGPTGPGTWSSFAEHAEVIWGKQGVCHIACNYDVSINCEHRICLHSITPERVMKHVLKLLTAILPETTHERLLLNPETEIEKTDDAFILKLNKNEWLIEFNDPAEIQMFERLLSNQLATGQFSASFQKLLDVFIQNELLFKIPQLALNAPGEPKTQQTDVTIVSHINSRDSIGRHGIIFGEILESVFTINGTATRQPSAQDIAPELFKKLTHKTDTGKLTIYTDVLWHDKNFEPFRKMPDDSSIKICYSMFESSAIPAEWVNIINSSFDGVWVPDEWLVSVYKSSGVIKPIQVLPLACYLQQFLNQPLKQQANEVFTFGISSALWLRKNITGVIEAFKKAFTAGEKVKLRIHSRYGLPAEVEQVRQVIDNDERIELNIVTLAPDAYVAFMASLDAYVFLSMGEGFSVTPREAMALGLPVVLSNNTVHQTICNSGLVYAVDTIKAIPAHYEVFNKAYGNFFMPDLQQASEYMQQIFEQRSSIYNVAQERRTWAAQYDISNMREIYIKNIKKILQRGFYENS